MAKQKHTNWTTVKKLGEGAQGSVHLAFRKGSFGDWYNDVWSGVATFTGITTDTQRVEMTDRFFNALQKRISEEVPEYGALKILHQPSERGSEFEKSKKRMKKEIEALSAIKHKNIVRIIDYDPDAEWYVSEYFKQGTLVENLDLFKGQPLQAVGAISGLVDGVSHLHAKGLVHRDIKPENIFIAEGNTLVLGDFGLVYFEDYKYTRVTDTFEKAGTSDWMPTWAQGRFRIDQVKPSFDVFSLAKILWAMIAGEGFLRLHWYEKTEFDLRRRYPNDPRMEFVNEIVLSKCLVEDEPDYEPKDIEIDLPRRLDLCYVISSSPDVLSFFADKRPSGNRTDFQRGVYRVTIRVDGEGIEPSVGRFLVKHMGDWNKVEVCSVE